MRRAVARAVAKGGSDEPPGRRTGAVGRRDVERRRASAGGREVAGARYADAVDRSMLGSTQQVGRKAWRVSWVCRMQRIDCPRRSEVERDSRLRTGRSSWFSEHQQCGRKLPFFCDRRCDVLGQQQSVASGRFESSQPRLNPRVPDGVRGTGEADFVAAALCSDIAYPWAGRHRCPHPAANLRRRAARTDPDGPIVIATRLPSHGRKARGMCRSGPHPHRRTT